ncbi:hypothetical protein BT96DRAFT_875290 [Gymnopus androsaceus JB14]|uniref:Uncharacterized protein n=1 Tax=Gymnopus androsaceus JB14 TaxID=1447944 RepID=A0A6A4I453_9AGAR|nr:hypothetical protein BT96DRAFT_875290 [Gymnopus androsaceus JB14]
MLRKGLRTRVRKFLFAMTVFMYIISSVDWALSVVNVIQDIQFWFLSITPEDNPPNFIPVFNAICLINYFLTDGVVVWRAWVLCSDQSRRALSIPIILLICLSLSITATIVTRLILTSPAGNHPGTSLYVTLTRVIDATQVTNLVLSLLTNISATSIVALKAWKYRQTIKHDLQSFRDRTAKGQRIMVLLVESGVLYIFSGITVLIASLVHLPNGTLGDIYSPINFQVAGIYPIVVLLLVNQENSVNKTIFLSVIPHPQEETRLETLHFAPVDNLSSSVPNTHTSLGLEQSRLRFSSQLKTLPELPLSSSDYLPDPKSFQNPTFQ